MKNDVILDYNWIRVFHSEDDYSEDDLQEPDQIYLYAKYVAKDKLSEIVEQRLYASIRHIYFYCKFLIENKKPAPEHLHNFLLANWNEASEKDKNYIKSFLELIKKNSE